MDAKQLAEWFAKLKGNEDFSARFTAAEGEIMAKALAAYTSPSYVQSEDSKRLDWMERNLCRAGEVKTGAGKTIGLARVWSIMGELGTLRETVDAAMHAGSDISLSEDSHG